MARVRLVRIAPDPQPVTWSAVWITAIFMVLLTVGTVLYHDRASDIRQCVLDRGVSSDAPYAVVEAACKANR